jgi:hypothetical protein
MLCARGISKVSSRAFRIAVFIEAGLMVFIGVAFGAFGPMLNVDPHVSRIVIVEIAFGMAAVLAAIAILMPPSMLAIFNTFAMGVIVLIGTTFVLPRFDKTDSMRPWQEVFRARVPSDQTVFVYRPPRWAEYGIQYYRPDNTVFVWTPEELEAALNSSTKTLFVSDDKGQAQLAQVAGLQMRVVTSVGNQWLFWAWRER